MGIEALSRNVHALIEKPADVFTKEVRALAAFAATRPDLSFGIMGNQRNNPLYQRINEIVDVGETGRSCAPTGLSRRGGARRNTTARGQQGGHAHPTHQA